VIFVTVDQEGIPNAIYASCVSKYDEATLVVADNHFHKTRKNILSGCKASLLFRTKHWKIYQMKEDAEYHTDSEIYEDMKRWNPPHRAGHGAAVLRIKEVFSGSKQWKITESPHKHGFLS
jgi:hypothetical protein